MDKEISALLSTALKNGLKQHELRDAANISKNSTPKYSKNETNWKYYSFVVLLVAVLLTAGLPKRAFRNPKTYFHDTFLSNVYNPTGNCLVDARSTVFDLTRPVLSCDICKGIGNEVPVFYNMSKEYFMRNHAYTGIPALIKGGAKDWSALNVFSFDYFKKLYMKKSVIEQLDNEECSFFGYKTNFGSLYHVFKMSKKRAALKKDQWYIGWSNCIESVQNALRKHYNRPTFLPDDSESSALDWIFMGGSGTGAMMHLDAVNRPSWQAMIKGKKTWHIEPPPECEFQCARHFSATMEPGDILVVDTNKWYHSTFIHPGEMAITIGSEYD